MSKDRNIKIIGHRGARGHATENTLASLQAALDIGVDMVEFDIWTSKDGVPFLLHDADFRRIAGHRGRIFEMDSRDIKKLRTEDGQKIVSAAEALKLLHRTRVYFEIKDYFLSQGVLDILNDFKKSEISVGSNNHKVLQQLRKKRPDLKLYAGTVWHPIETVHFIRKNNLYGLSLHYRWFSPIIYFYCRRYKIDLMLYTVNKYWHLKHLMRFYPGISICTDYPDRAKKALAEVSR